MGAMVTDVLILTASAFIPPALGYGIYRWRMLKKIKEQRRPLDTMYGEIGRELEHPSTRTPPDDTAE